MMKNNELKKQVTEEVIRIGDWLLSRAKKDGDGMYWESQTMDMERNIEWREAENIYAGVAGIVLFLLELHKFTGKPEYKNAALEGMRWVVSYCKKNPSNYYAFFTGRMGVPYVLLRMAEVTGQDHWKETALEIAKSSTSSLEAPQVVDDLINGTSGTVMGLLHLHAATGESWLLKDIDTLVNHLIQSAYQGPTGLYWDRSPKCISGLCGFSHGAAGIGWVFMELGRYFHNEAFYRIAEQAFLYEANFFSDTGKNWTDLRKGTYNDDDEKEHREAYLKNDMDFFTKGGDMNAWCHGAAGIGLSRLRAYELFKDVFKNDNYKLYREHALNAIEKTTRTNVDAEGTNFSYILCHGGGGNADLFINAYETFGDEKYLSLAEKVAEKALAYWKEKGMYMSGFAGADAEDTSLFMGSAGTGHFYLRLLAPDDVPSILAPSPKKTFAGGPEALSAYSAIGISTPGAVRRLLEKYFQRTLLTAEKFLPTELTAFFNEPLLDINEKPLRRSFIDFIKKVSSSLPPKKQNCLSDVFTLESEKVKMDEAIVSHSYLEAKRKHFKEIAEELIKIDEQKFLELLLVTEQDALIASTDWNWYMSNEEEWSNNINLEPDVYPILLKPTSLNIMEEQLSPMSYTILNAFEKGKTVKEAIQETIDAFEALTPEQENMLKGKIVEQIQQALLAGILIEG
jgi:hypothetical protein